MPAKLTYNQESDYRRERDFGAKVSATFEFVGAQFRPLFKCVAYFVLPGALLAGMGLGLVLGDFMALMPNADGRLKSSGALGAGSSPFTGTSLLGLGVGTLGLLIAFLLLSSTVYAYVRVRVETPPTEAVTPARVWALVGPRLGRVLLAWLVLAAGSVLVMGALGGALAQLGPGFVVLLFPVIMWASICLVLYFPVLWMEDGGVLTALRRCFYLVRGKWWSTLGLFMVMSFITSMLNYLFLIPFYVLLGARVALHIPGLDSGILSVAAMSIYALGWIFTAVLPLLAALFQYFNLVERKEGLGLRLMVNSLGQMPAPQARNATYQADEEGEY